MEKTKDINSKKNSTRGYLKEEFEKLDTNILDKEKLDLNPQEKKLMEMNPNFNIEAIKKLQNEKNNNKNLSKIIEIEENKRPLTTRLNKIKENYSNIFNSEVRKI